jgi:hypothetical protein
LIKNQQQSRNFFFVGFRVGRPGFLLGGVKTIKGCLSGEYIIAVVVPLMFLMMLMLI